MDGFSLIYFRHPSSTIVTGEVLVGTFLSAVPLRRRRHSPLTHSTGLS